MRTIDWVVQLSALSFFLVACKTDDGRAGLKETAEQMLSSELDQYTGAPVSRLILESTSPLRGISYYHSDSRSKLDGLFLSYENGIVLLAQFDDLKYLSRYDSTGHWDLTMCIAESVGSAKVIDPGEDTFISPQKLIVRLVARDSLSIISPASVDVQSRRPANADL